MIIFLVVCRNSTFLFISLKEIKNEGIMNYYIQQSYMQTYRYTRIVRNVEENLL